MRVAHTLAGLTVLGALAIPIPAEEPKSPTFGKPSTFAKATVDKTVGKQALEARPAS